MKVKRYSGVVRCAALLIMFCCLFIFAPSIGADGATATTTQTLKTTTVYLVRHAEKAATPKDDPPLTEAGEARAKALTRILAKANIKTIIVSQFLRTKDTAAPLAKMIGITTTVIPVGMDTMTPNVLSPQYLKDVANRIYANAGDNVLIVGHSNTVPALIKELGGDIVPAIEETDYDNLFVVTVLDKGKAKVAHLRQ